MYNKQIFKQLVLEFGNEIKERKNEINNGIYETTKVVGQSLFKLIPYIREDFPIVYSTCSVRFDSIFKRKPNTDSKLHDANIWKDIECLYNGIKYQILAHKDKYVGITEDEFQYVYWGYLIMLAKNYNWTRTYNENGQYHYLDWFNTYDNILLTTKVSETYKTIFIDNDNTVKDINGQIKKINIKNESYNTMKRLTKQELINIINQFTIPPTVKQITDYYMSTVELIDIANIADPDEFYNAANINKSKTISPELMRKYIKEYGLESLIKNCNHSEAFIQK